MLRGSWKPSCVLSPLKVPCPKLSHLGLDLVSWCLEAEGTKMNEIVFYLELLGEKRGKEPETEEH